MSSVFISYARENAEDAYKITSLLKAYGINAWFDQEELLAGQQWEIEIRKAIKKSDYVIFLLSNSSLNKRGFVQKEIKQALNILDEFPEHRVFVIPARLELCEVFNEKLQSMQWIDMFPSFELGVQKIIDALKKHDAISVEPTRNVEKNKTPSRILPKNTVANSENKGLSEIAHNLLVRDVLSKKNYLPYLNIWVCLAFCRFRINKRTKSYGHRCR